MYCTDNKWKVFGHLWWRFHKRKEDAEEYADEFVSSGPYKIEKVEQSEINEYLSLWYL